MQYGSVGRGEVKKAMDRWNTVKVNGSTPVNMRLTTGSSSNSVDYYNDMYDDYVAYCNISHSATEIYSVNIDLNTFYWNFSQGAVPGCFDVQSIVLHELGHGLGIRHCHEAGDPDPCWSPTCHQNIMYRLCDDNCVKITFQAYDTSSYQVIYW